MTKVSLTRRCVFGLALLGAIVPAAVHAQQSAVPAAAPSTGPTTAPAPAPLVVTVPEGFKKVTVGGINLLCAPADEQWAKTAVADYKPTTQPTAMPAQVLDRLKADRAKFATQVQTDLALKDLKELDKLLDESLTPALKNVAANPPVFYYMPVKADKFKQMVQSGWANNQFYFNRRLESVESGNPRISTDGASDEFIVPCLFDDKTAETDKPKILLATVQRAQQERDGAIAQFSVQIVNRTMSVLVLKEGVAPLLKQREQHWLALGIEAVLSTKYTASLTGLPFKELLAGLIRNQQLRGRAQMIDLLHPTEETSLRPEAISFYNNAMRSRAADVVQFWIEDKGENVIPKTLTAIRDKTPADGAALLKLIQDTTGADLAKYLPAAGM